MLRRSVNTGQSQLIKAGRFIEIEALRILNAVIQNVTLDGFVFHKLSDDLHVEFTAQNGDRPQQFAVGFALMQMTDDLTVYLKIIRIEFH